jgi:hypothetical protein
MKKEKPITCFHWCYIHNLKTFVYYLHLLVVSIEHFIVEEYDRSIYNLCFWNVIIIYILWKIIMLNLHSTNLMKIVTLIFFTWLLTQFNQWQKLVNKEFLISRRFQVNPKKIKCSLQYVPQCWFFCLTNIRNCWITNRNRKDLFFN